MKLKIDRFMSWTRTNRSGYTVVAKFISLFDRPAVRYLLVGGVAYVIELAVIIIAQHQGVRPVTAVACSFVIGTLVSFLMHKLVTFSDKRMHHKLVVSQFAAVCLLVLFNFGFTLLVVKLSTPPIPTVASRTLALLITTAWNFYLYRTKIFKQ